MVRGPLRTVLWVLGGPGVIWAVLWLIGLPAMGGMMGAMVVQTLGMLGLAGVFVFLMVDTLSGRGEQERRAPTLEPGR